MAQSTYLYKLRAPATRFVSALTVGVACSLSLSANADTIPGEIILVAGECPGGYLPADGSQVDLTAYPELASVVQTSYGGTGGSMGTIGLPSVESASVLQDTYDYVYSKDEIAMLASPATSYLVKVSDDRNLRNVIEVTVPK